MGPRVRPAVFRMYFNVSAPMVATLEPYNVAGLRPETNTWRPRRLPSRRVLARRAALTAHRERMPPGHRVFAPGPNWIPRCFALDFTTIPRRRIEVETPFRTASPDTATTVLAFPTVAHRSLLEIFKARSPSSICTKSSVAVVTVEATSEWLPTTCNAMSSTYKQTLSFPSHLTWMTSRGSINTSKRAICAKPPPARTADSVRVPSEMAPW